MGKKRENCFFFVDKERIYYYGSGHLGGVGASEQVDEEEGMGIMVISNSY